MRRCLFCDNPANSNEDLIPKWILRKPDIRQPFRRKLGKTILKWTENVDIKVKSVCKPCNETWMSELEGAIKPFMGLLIDDFSLPLDSSEQNLIAIWSAKTAMILDSARKELRFYEKSACQDLRLGSTIPKETAVWIGRYIGRSIHVGDTNFEIENGPIHIGKGRATTFLFGHLAIQVLTTRVFSEFRN